MPGVEVSGQQWVLTEQSCEALVRSGAWLQGLAGWGAAWREAGDTGVPSTGSCRGEALAVGVGCLVRTGRLGLQSCQVCELLGVLKEGKREGIGGPASPHRGAP